jgi:hypothetical protein
MTYFDAALAVLQDAERPLTTREIVASALTRGLIEPRGKTPEATMSAELYRKAAFDRRLVRMATPGAKRAKRGSVRWRLRTLKRTKR